MPTTSQELRERIHHRFGSIDYTGPVAFLKNAGWVLKGNHQWLPKSGVQTFHDATQEEWECFLFLIQEWDYGGLAASQSPRKQEQIPQPLGQLKAAAERAEAITDCYITLAITSGGILVRGKTSGPGKTVDTSQVVSWPKLEHQAVDLVGLTVEQVRTDILTFVGRMKASDQTQ